MPLTRGTAPRIPEIEFEFKLWFLAQVPPTFALVALVTPTGAFVALVTLKGAFVALVTPTDA